jgi:predicted Ser/Thr protein kinase
MLELKTGDRVTLTNGSEATIVKELGRGGQGIVYLVELGGQKMALKWYLNKTTEWFYKNLEENIAIAQIIPPMQLKYHIPPSSARLSL